MNQLVAAGAAFFLALTLLGLGRKPKTLLNTKTSENLTVQPFSLVIVPRAKQKVNSGIESVHFSLPKTEKEKFLLRKKLQNLIESGPEDRLMAVNCSGSECQLPSFGKSKLNNVSTTLRASCLSERACGALS